MIKKIDLKAENFDLILENIYFLENKIFGLEAYSLNSLKHFSKQNNIYSIFYYENKGKILAYLIVSDNLDSYDILKIAVVEECRGQNLANLLLDEISDKNILLEVREGNLRAINFYKKNNFKQISIRKNYYKDNGENALIMLKEIV